MAPNPTCSALDAAIRKTGYTYEQLATAIGGSEQRVIDVCTGKATATDSEFKALASALGITEQSTHSHVTIH